MIESLFTKCSRQISVHCSTLITSSSWLADRARLCLPLDDFDRRRRGSLFGPASGGQYWAGADNLSTEETGLPNYMLPVLNLLEYVTAALILGGLAMKGRRPGRFRLS